LPITPPEAKQSNLLLGGVCGSGINFNIVPARAFFTIDRRFNPEERMKDVEEEIMAVLDKNREKGMKLAVDVIQKGNSSLSSPTSRTAEALNHAIKDVTGEKALFSLCPGLCETRFFSQQGIPAYAYGPGLLENAHSPGEFVEIERMLDCTKVYALTAFKLLNS
jgi:acetylornithine deacetylase/succinyl-diaminopimelate desuccinylase-like protein